MKDLWGHIRATGEFVIPPKFADAGVFSEGMAAARLQTSSGSPSDVAYIDAKGNMIVQATYDRGGTFCNGLAPVKKGGKFGYIDKAGHLVIQNLLSDASQFIGDLAPVVTEDGKRAWVNKTGKIVWFSDRSPSLSY